MGKLTLYLILACVAIFFLELFISFEDFYFTPAYAFEQPWTFVTSIFLHADLTHLFFNMFALFIFGISLESRVSKGTYLSIFFLAGIVGNLGYWLTAADATIPAVGASGAIYGIMGCLAMLTPLMIVYVGGMPMPMIIAAVFWAWMEISGALVPVGNIAHGSHLGGLAIGTLFGVYLKIKKR